MCVDCAKKVFKQDPVSTVNVDEVVALGHAFMLHIRVMELGCPKYKRNQFPN